MFKISNPILIVVNRPREGSANWYEWRHYSLWRHNGAFRSFSGEFPRTGVHRIPLIVQMFRLRQNCTLRKAPSDGVLQSCQMLIVQNPKRESLRLRLITGDKRSCFRPVAANAQHVRNRKLECEDSKYKGSMYGERVLLLVRPRLELEVKRKGLS